MRCRPPILVGIGIAGSFACSSFGTAVNEDAKDAGGSGDAASESSILRPEDGGGDAAADGSKDGATTSICTPAHFWCDDFERPNISGSFWSVPSIMNNGIATVVSTAEGRAW